MSVSPGTLLPPPAVHRAEPRAAALPLISVVTPSFNQGRFIERCIRSVLAQNYPRCEHIVQDNCSTDETLAVLRRYPHVQWVSAPDRGQSDALNRALARARGEIIAWINADDYYEPGAFALVARELRRETGLMVLLGRLHVVDAEGRLLQTTSPRYHGHEYLVDVWTHDHGLSQPGMFFRREALERVGPLDPRLHYAMDYDLWLRLTRHFPIKVVDDVLAGFVLHPQSKTGQTRYLAGFMREKEQVSRRYWGSVFTPRYWRLRQACNRSLATVLTHAILDSHKHDTDFKWRLVAELLWRWPPALANRYILAALAERIAGRGVPRAAKQLSTLFRPAPAPVANTPPCKGRVTVVIPTYNRAALVERAIQSVLRQTARERCDIVVVDDGSTDHTPQVLQRYAGEIRYIRQANAGVAAARNAAIRGQRNEYVAFLDSDDEWLPTKIERQLAMLERYPEAVLVACDGRRRAVDGQEWRSELTGIEFGRPIDLAPHLFNGLFLLTPGIVVRARHLPPAGPFCRSVDSCEDYLLWVQMACRGPGIVLNEELVRCGWHAPHSLTDNVAHVARTQILARHLAWRALRHRPDCRAAWRQGLARMLAMQRDAAYRAGRFGLAARLGFRSLMLVPRGRPRWEWGRLVTSLLRCVKR